MSREAINFFFRHPPIRELVRVGACVRWVCVCVGCVEGEGPCCWHGAPPHCMAAAGARTLNNNQVETMRGCLLDRNNGPGEKKKKEKQVAAHNKTSVRTCALIPINNSFVSVHVHVHGFFYS